MGKGKKKSKHQVGELDALLNITALSIKQFRRVTKQLGKLSTGQKVAGALALLAAGLTYLAKQQQADPAELVATDKNNSAPVIAKQIIRRKKRFPDL